MLKKCALIYDNVLFREARGGTEKDQNKPLPLVWNYFFKDASNKRLLTIVASLY